MCSNCSILCRAPHQNTDYISLLPILATCTPFPTAPSPVLLSFGFYHPVMLFKIYCVVISAAKIDSVYSLWLKVYFFYTKLLYSFGFNISCFKSKRLTCVDLQTIRVKIIIVATKVLKTKINQQNAQIHSGLIYY